MKIVESLKEEFKKPVVKVTAISLPVLIGGIFAYKRYTQKKQWDSFKTGGSDAAVIPGSGTTETSTTTAYDNSIGLRTYKGYQYNVKSLMIGRSRYEFTISGIEKMQRYLAKKSRKAAEHIANNNGFDGKIGEGFIKALDAYLGSGSSRITKLKALLKNSGLTKAEMKILG